MALATNARNPRSDMTQLLEQRTLGDTSGGARRNQAESGTVDSTLDARQARGQQQDLAGMLLQQAQGQGPSLAQNQLNQGADRAVANAFALANSQGGAGGGALAARQAQQQAASIGQGLAGQSANLRLQEQMQAQSQLGGLLQGVRSGDLAQQGTFDNRAGRLADEAFRSANADANLGFNVDKANLDSANLTRQFNHQEQMEAIAARRQQEARQQSFYNNLFGQALGASSTIATGGLG